MSLKDCFDKGLLRMDAVDESKIRGSLASAKHFLERAEGNLENEYFDVAFLMAYNSMFHSARALLFSKGVKERSHACLMLFLKKEFSKNKEILDSVTILDGYRLTRHAVQYAGGLCSETDAVEAINDAKKFLTAAEKIIPKERQP